jgi:hypothetical protein
MLGAYIRPTIVVEIRSRRITFTSLIDRPQPCLNAGSTFNTIQLITKAPCLGEVRFCRPAHGIHPIVLLLA